MKATAIDRLGVAGALVGSALAAGAGERANVIALTGQAAPVGQSGVTFLSLDYPAINHAGQVVFHGTLAGGSVTPLDNTGYFIAAGSSLALAAREGDAIENQSGALGLGQTWPRAFSETGQVAFGGSVTTLLPVYTAAAFVAAPGTPVRALAIAGEEYPDGSGDKWGNTFNIAQNDGGVVAVVDGFKSAWRGAGPESIIPIARIGDPAGSDLIHEIRYGHVRMNGSGLMVFDAQVSPDGSGAEARPAVLASLGAGPLIRIFKAGEPAPGAPPETTFASFFLEGLSIGGATLIDASLAGPSISASNDRGLWLAPHPASAAPMGPMKLVQENDPAPGLGPSARFATVYTSPLLTGDGRAIFMANVTGADSGGGHTVWEVRPRTEAKRLIGLGDSAAGLPEGVTVQSIYYPAANAAGQATFGLALTGPGIGQPNYQAVIGYDPILGRVLLARAGDEVEVAPGDVRTIERFGLSAGGLGRMAGGTGHDGLVTPLNDQGLLTFKVTFTDDSEAILTVRVPVAGDAMYDGLVNSADFEILFDNFGGTFEAGDRSRADFNLDGIVNFADFQLLERNFGYAPPGFDAGITAGDRAEVAAFARAVPEPGALMWIGLAAGALLRRSRQYRR